MSSHRCVYAAAAVLSTGFCAAPQQPLFANNTAKPGAETSRFAQPPMSGVELSKLLKNARQEADREKDVLIPVLAQGDPRRKEIALTFDDGPHPLWTPQLLDLLKSLNVRATFFLVGKMVDKYPALAMREVAEGHEIANHTYNHPNLKKLTQAQVENELTKGAEAIKRAVGYAPVFFRPPGGQYNGVTLEAAREVKMVPVLWTANSKDFMHPTPETVEHRLLSAPMAGGILLCHDGIEETMRVLPDLVNRLRAKGYTFVTVSELAQHARNASSQSTQ